MEPADVAAILPNEMSTHTAATRVLLVVAGSRDMTGAAHLVAEAAGRTARGSSRSQSPRPSCRWCRLNCGDNVPAPAETPDGSIALPALELLLGRLEGADALAKSVPASP